MSVTKRALTHALAVMRECLRETGSCDRPVRTPAVRRRAAVLVGALLLLGTVGTGTAAAAADPLDPTWLPRVAGLPLCGPPLPVGQDRPPFFAIRTVWRNSKTGKDAPARWCYWVVGAPAIDIDVEGDSDKDLRVFAQSLDGATARFVVDRVGSSPSLPVQVEAVVAPGGEGSEANARVAFGYDTRATNAPRRFDTELTLGRATDLEEVVDCDFSDLYNGREEECSVRALDLAPTANHNVDVHLEVTPSGSSRYTVIGERYTEGLTREDRLRSRRGSINFVNPPTSADFNLGIAGDKTIVGVRSNVKTIATAHADVYVAESDAVVTVDGTISQLPAAQSGRMLLEIQTKPLVSVVYHGQGRIASMDAAVVKRPADNPRTRENEAATILQSIGVKLRDAAPYLTFVQLADREFRFVSKRSKEGPYEKTHVAEAAVGVERAHAYFTPAVDPNVRANDSYLYADHDEQERSSIAVRAFDIETVTADAADVGDDLDPIDVDIPTVGTTISDDRFVLRRETPERLVRAVADPLPSRVHLTLSLDEGTLGYEANRKLDAFDLWASGDAIAGPGDLLHVQLLEVGPSTGAATIEATFQTSPPAFDLTTGSIGTTKVWITKGPVTVPTSLTGGADGMKLEDYTARDGTFMLFATVSKIKGFSFDHRPNGELLRVTLRSDGKRGLRVDVERDDPSQDGTADEYLLATLGSLPSEVSLTTNKIADAEEVHYSASAFAGPFHLETDQGARTRLTIYIPILPTSVDFCLANSDHCTRNTPGGWSYRPFEQGTSVVVDASSRLTVSMFDCVSGTYGNCEHNYDEYRKLTEVSVKTLRLEFEAPEAPRTDLGHLYIDTRNATDTDEEARLSGLFALRGVNPECGTRTVVEGGLGPEFWADDRFVRLKAETLDFNPEPCDVKTGVETYGRTGDIHCGPKTWIQVKQLASLHNEVCGGIGL